MIIDKLYQEVKEKGPVCVGLDTRIEYLPTYLQKADLPVSDKLFAFNRAIIDSTSADAACYKVQIASYEALGLEGLGAYARTLSYIRAQGKLVIADVKRSDISSTAKLYAMGHFSGDFEADFITLNPYLGRDSISPYFDYLRTGEKGIFVLMRTSNPGSRDFQELEVDGQPLYLRSARMIEEWGAEFRGENGYSLLGGVVGLTYPEELQEIRQACRNTFFLIPGYGAQGGRGKELAPLLKEDSCAVVNSSRAIITAHLGVNEGRAFADEAHKRVVAMKEDILQWLK